MIEGMRRAPTLDFARRCDEVFATAATYERLQQHARTMPLPLWFRPWADVEAVATRLCMSEHSLVPGLLQTEDYARALLATRPNTTEDELDSLVAARMDRQAILDRPAPPVLWVVVDEAVLHRQVGSAKVTHDQLLDLADVSARPNVTIQVVPYSAGVYFALQGGFAIAETGEGTRVAYLDTAGEGYVAEGRETVAGLAFTFDTLRAEALPRGASRDLILKVAGEEHDRSD
jgi:hypothetical protein